MTTAEIAMLIIGAAGSLGTIAAVVLSNRDTKRTMSVAWGAFTNEVQTHSREIGELREGQLDHEKRISYIEGGNKANGHYAGGD